jgi:hypothetical protein
MKPATLAPVYVMLWARMSEAARSCGYALAVHGTMSLDLDVVAIPWTAEAKSDEDVVRAMAEAVAERAGSDLVIGGPNHHAPHGRVRWSIPYSAEDGFTTAGYVNISVMPRASRASTGTDPGLARFDEQTLRDLVLGRSDRVSPHDAQRIAAALRAHAAFVRFVTDGVSEYRKGDIPVAWLVEGIEEEAKKIGDPQPLASPVRAESDPGATDGRKTGIELAALILEAAPEPWGMTAATRVRSLLFVAPGPEPREAELVRIALTLPEVLGYVREAVGVLQVRASPGDAARLNGAANTLERQIARLRALSSQRDPATGGKGDA